ncbi:hypothetical protein CW304_21060 [Bacillus sp. UFRGS-B20]|nr:hypothetical protein CW304_21060 [Bacillus sp. UFRGS-B20]
MAAFQRFQYANISLQLLLLSAVYNRASKIFFLWEFIILDQTNSYFRLSKLDSWIVRSYCLYTEFPVRILREPLVSQHLVYLSPLQSPLKRLFHMLISLFLFLSDISTRS